MQQASPSPRRANWPDRISKVSTDTTRGIVVGFTLIAVCIGGMGVWAATAPISSAVVANGQVVVATKRRTIQHPTGGVIRTLHVEDGSIVPEGAVLIELEDADAADRYTRTRDSLYFGLASEARLIAETEEKETPEFSEELIKAAAQQRPIKAIVDGQAQLFKVRRAEIHGQLSILETQHEQLTNELKGIESERRSATEQIAMTKEELKVVEDLYEKGYTTRTRVFSLKRDIAALTGTIGKLTALAARTKNSLIESGLKLVQAKNQLQTSINNELREIQAKIPNLREQYRAANLAYERMTIRAPVAGTVMASRVNTLGSVVRPGETVLEIVPANDRLMIEVQLRPTDVDSVKVGLDTEIRLTGLNQRNTEPIKGRVSHVSADAMLDPRTNAAYFIAHVDVPASEIDRLVRAEQMQPGVPASVMIKTGERTALAYLTQPLADTVTRAWREE